MKSWNFYQVFLIVENSEHGFATFREYLNENILSNPNATPIQTQTQPRLGGFDKKIMLHKTNFQLESNTG